MRSIFLAMICLGISGCNSSNWSTTMDESYFEWFGATLFSKPTVTTTKKIRFDSSLMLGKQVVIEGPIVEISDHFTYMVIADKTARMLINLTEIPEAKHFFDSRKPRILKVLGTVESGKKGLPFIMAQSMSIVRAGKKKS